MNGILLVLPLLLVTARGDEDQRPPGPDPKVVAEAVADLEEAFEKGETEDRVQAIERNSSVFAPEVVDWMEKGLKPSREHEVRRAALGALRWIEHPDALELLHKTHKRDKKLRKSEELYLALLKGIGQHGDPSSIEVLTDYSVKDSNGNTAEARVLGLGMTRDKKSITALFKLMRSFGPKRTQQRMDWFQLALVMLAGDDFGGRSQEQWTAWWNKNKKRFEVSPEAPKLPDKWQRRWNSYWDLEVEYERPTRRRERGGGQ